MISHKKHRLLMALVGTGSFLAVPTLAQSISWSTTPTSGNFSGTANWNAGATPGAADGTVIASGDSLYFGTSTTTALTDDVSGLTLTGITFDTGSAAYTIGGDAFEVNGTIANNSATAQTINDNIIVNGADTLSFNSSIGNDPGINLNGNISGSGTINDPENLNALNLGGDNSGFTGTFTMGNGGTNRLHFNSATSGSAAAAWVFNTPNAGGAVQISAAAGSTINFGSLAGTSGGSSATVRSGTIGTTIISVGALNTSTTFATNIVNSNVSGGTTNAFLGLTKVGTGTLTLTATGSNFSGGTIVNDGTLALGGAHAAGEGAVTINTGGTVSTEISSGLGAGGATGPTITTMSGGTLLNANAAALGAASNVQDGGQLALTSSSTSFLDFGTANTGADFDFSSLGTGTGTLDILDYAGTPAVGGGLDQLFIGTTDSLTSSQLSQIIFENAGAGSTAQLADGEIVYDLSAAPEPSQVGMIALMALGLGGLLLTARKRQTLSA